MRRRGTSLVELMVSLGIMGVISAISISLLLTLFQLERAITADGEELRVLRRLETTLRADALTAVQIGFFEGRLVFDCDSEIVEYFRSNSGENLHRIARGNDGSLTAEAFAAPEGTSPEWKLTSDGVRRVSLTFRPHEHRRKLNAPRRVEVVLPGDIIAENLP